MRYLNSLLGIGRVVGMVALLGAMGAGEGKIVDVKGMGAKGDGISVDTGVIQKAIDEVASQGGGVVRLTEGTYLSGAIFLKSNVTLQVDEKAVLKGTQRPADYPMIDTRWEGIERKMPASLVNAIDAHDVAVVGKGTIDGSGEYWWTWSRTHKEERWNRPRLVEFLRCSKVRVEGLSLKDSANWILHPIYCTDVVIADLTITAPERSPNTDGIDPDSCNGMTITRCMIDCGDDCIAIKSGKNEDGRRVGKACENITITDCVMKHGHGGVAIGSEMSGGVRNVLIKNCRFEGTDRGVRLKTARGRGGVMEKITYENIVMKDVGTAIEFTMRYSDGMTPKQKDEARAVDETTPAIREIRLVNIKGSGIKSAGSIIGLPESPIEGVVMENVVLEGGGEVVIRDAKVEGRALRQ